MFPCGSPIEGELTTRIELLAAPSGDAEPAPFSPTGPSDLRRSEADALADVPPRLSESNESSNVANRFKEKSHG